MARPDRRSAEAAAYRAWYKSPRWQRLRSDQLAIEPLCRMCAAVGRITAATVCDHVIPHRGDETLFWSGPFQSLCAPHHDTTKQRAERLGFAVGCDVAGRPTDPTHPWNRRTTG